MDRITFCAMSASGRQAQLRIALVAAQRIAPPREHFDWRAAMLDAERATADEQWEFIERVNDLLKYRLDGKLVPVKLIDGDDGLSVCNCDC